MGLRAGFTPSWRILRMRIEMEVEVGTSTWCGDGAGLGQMAARRED